MIPRLIDGLATVVLTYRKTILLLIAAITALAVVELPKTRFDNALEIWFLDNDPALLSHQRLVNTYASDEYIMVGLEAPDVFAPNVLRAIDRVTRAVADAPYVEKVFSLTNIESVTGEDGMLDVGDLVHFPLDEAELPAIRRRALANRLYVGNVVSAAGDFAAIIVRIPHRTDDFDYKIEAVDAIRTIIHTEAERSGIHFYLGGGPVVDEQFFLLAERDSEVTTSVMLVLLVIVLWLLLRNAAGVLLPLVTVMLATMWGIAWIELAGSRVNVITTMLPSLLLAVGVADSIHFLVDYQNRCRAGEEKLAALRAVFRDLTTPLFLTTLTTAIGMLSLSVSRLQGIREFGIFAALGVWGALLLSLTLVPITLSYLPPPRPATGRMSSHGLSATFLRRLHAFTMRRSRAIVAAFAAVTVVSAIGATQVKAESAFMEMFKKNAPVRVDTKRIEDALAGTLTLEVMIDTGTEGGVKDPAMLHKVEEIQRWLEQQPEISSSQAVTDYFRDLRRAFFDNDQAQYRLPETREEAAQYLLLYELDAPDGDIGEFVTPDYRETRISARLSMESSATATRVIKATNAYLHSHLPPGVTGQASGVALLYANMEMYIMRSLTRGFTIALIAIFIVFCIQLRSVALGAIAMIPNIFPIVVCLGVMGAAGINLDGMTALVASIAIGLAVDDTIHYVTRVRMHLNAGDEMLTALRESTIEMGRAIVYTSVTLGCGFGVMMLAHFKGMVYFGLLATITIVFALLADLLLLPVVLRWRRQRQAIRVGETAYSPAGGD